MGDERERVHFAELVGVAVHGMYIVPSGGKRIALDASLFREQREQALVMPVRNEVCVLRAAE